jgi:hypothetical protein
MFKKSVKKTEKIEDELVNRNYRTSRKLEAELSSYCRENAKKKEQVICHAIELYLKEVVKCK